MIIMELRCKYVPFWQEFSVKSLMLRWPLRPVGLLFTYYIIRGLRGQSLSNVLKAANILKNNIDHKFLKETLKLILRKIHKMRFFPGLCVFLLHRWKYKLSENNTILKLKITVLSKKLIISCGLVNKYCCLLLSLSWHMRRKHKHYQHGLQREKRTVRRPRYITDSDRKRLKGEV